VLLADSTRNYMSKFLNDSWMVENDFLEDKELNMQWWANMSVGNLKLQAPMTINPNVSCKNCLSILEKQGFDQMPVVGEDGVMGMVTTGNLSSKMTRGLVRPEDVVSKAIYKQFKQIDLSCTLGELSRIFDKDHFALVVTTNKYIGSDSENPVQERAVVVGVATRIDLLNFIITTREAK
jgi:cystathionine beta-synthase